MFFAELRKPSYMRHFFDTERVIRQNAHMVDYELPELQSLADYRFLRTELDNKKTTIKRNLKILDNEVRKLKRETGSSSGLDADVFIMASFDRHKLNSLIQYLNHLKEYYNNGRTEASRQKEEIEKGLTEQLGAQGLEKLRGEYFNKSIHQLALNELELESVVVSGDHLVQKVLPIYQEPSTAWGRSHFYAERKRFGNAYVSTFHFNMVALWTLCLIGYLVFF